MKALVLYTADEWMKKVAEAVAEGAKEVKFEVDVVEAGKEKDYAGYDFVFFGSKLGNQLDPKTTAYFEKLKSKPIALFFVATFTNKKVMDDLLKKAEDVHAQVKNTFSAKLTGFLASLGMGSVKEEDLIRARGFAERTLNNHFNLEYGKESEKAKIKGYLK
ncbi:hypothetical protein HZC09_01850 [Candidatus Micrarchaeota archaeon]|nr:hypothetical protein [Candidatus Micrarchaeota archaeon]